MGNGNKEIMVFNFSMGCLIYKLVFDSNVIVLDVDYLGVILFVGDVRGIVYSVIIKMYYGNFVMWSIY